MELPAVEPGPICAIHYPTMTDPRPITLFGCNLDADERQGAIDQKLMRGGVCGPGDDPFTALWELLSAELGPKRVKLGQSLGVPAWLTPVPPAEELDTMLVENFVGFTDHGGCGDCTRALQETMAPLVPPALPALVAVDHCLAAAPLRLLSNQLGPENLSVVVLDSHTDALPVPVLARAIAYDIDTNPQSVYHASDPFLHGRPDSFNASSFLSHLIAEGTLLPRNLYLLGMGDLPPKRAKRNKDPRVRAYTQVFAQLAKDGVRLVSKKDLASGSGKLKAILGRIKTPHLYVSVDMDIGAGNALSGVRFDERVGLSQTQIMAIIRSLRAVMDSGPALAGLDVCEFNPRAMGPGDATYRIAADVIKLLAFGLEPK